MVINIIPEDLGEMIERGKKPVIIDVRESFEYEIGHIKDSVLIPMYEIFNNTEKLSEFKNKDIVLVCSTGHRSFYTAKFLEEKGFKNIYNLYNGMYGWELANNEIES